MKVIIESPYAGEIGRNIDYARKCMKDSLLRGEFPLASHLLYTQPGILDDSITIERNLGIAAGLEWGKMAEKTIVYTDYGISKGMQFGIENAIENNREVQYRTIL
jgi:hypothetical protein